MSNDMEKNRTEDALANAARAYINRFDGVADRLLSPGLRDLRKAVQAYDAARRTDAAPKSAMSDAARGIGGAA